jgi:hypothetical protein
MALEDTVANVCNNELPYTVPGSAAATAADKDEPRKLRRFITVPFFCSQPHSLSYASYFHTKIANGSTFIYGACLMLLSEALGLILANYSCV